MTQAHTPTISQTIDRTNAHFNSWLYTEATISEMLHLLPSEVELEAVPHGLRMKYQGRVISEGLPRLALAEFLEVR